MDMIEVNNLTKYYGPTAALKNISFTVKKGEILGFLGPNGAGKTTAMSILTCLFPPTSGTAKVSGYDVLEEPLSVKGQIGYLPENVCLYGDMVVRDYLKFAAELKGIQKKEITKNVDKVIGETEISGVAHRMIKKLSRGYLQRVGIAQALLNDPPILILDEPTIGLDPMQIISIRKLVKNLSGERTVILCSHILPEVSQITERVIIINEGELVAADTPENLTKRLKKSGRVSITVGGPESEIKKTISALSGVKGVKGGGKTPSGATFFVEQKPGGDIRADLSRAIVGKGYDLVELRSEEVSLEEIFIKLVTEEKEV
jgi:ABC-2 type transport system ATP-binding protein